MKKASFAISLLLTAALGFLLGQSYTPRKASAGSSRLVLYYVDPMHPSYKSDKPGIAPDCGMQLEPVYAEQEVGVADPGSPAPTIPGAVHIDSERQQLIGIRVAAVEKTSGTRVLRIPGRVTADETRVFRVNASSEGLVRETHEDTVGTPVKKGQLLAVVYSQEFASGIAGYISAIEQAQNSMKDKETAVIRNSLGVKTWADRLGNLGMSQAQIQEIYETRKMPEGIKVVSPADGFIIARNIHTGLRFDRNMELYRIADLSHVWIVAAIFESQAPYYHRGAAARIALPDQNRSFSARVSDSLPQLDPNSRSLLLRLDADNPNFALLPDMFVDVDLTIASPPGLSVPTGAVLDAGLSKVVYVDRGQGILEPREVQTGESYGGRVLILSGLAEGEKVVASGTFLVDSESRLSAPAESVR